MATFDGFNISNRPGWAHTSRPVDILSGGKHPIEKAPRWIRGEALGAPRRTVRRYDPLLRKDTRSSHISREGHSIPVEHLLPRQGADTPAWNQRHRQWSPRIQLPPSGIISEGQSIPIQEFQVPEGRDFHGNIGSPFQDHGVTESYPGLPSTTGARYSTWGKGIPTWTEKEQQAAADYVMHPFEKKAKDFWLNQLPDYLPQYNPDFDPWLVDYSLNPAFDPWFLDYSPNPDFDARLLKY